MSRASIFLGFAPAVTLQVRSRIYYALRVFAAIFDYRVTEVSSEASLCCVYGEENSDQDIETRFRIPARYSPEIETGSLPKLLFTTYAREDLHLIYGRDEKSGNPDWLGEIFHWLSCSLELPIVGRDSVGRIPYRDSIYAQHQISSLKPHALLMMSWFENVLQNGNAVEALPKASTPVPGIEHMVVSSHDLDFCFTDTAAAAWRLSRNLGISLTHYRSASFLLSNARMLFSLLRGGQPGKYIGRMLSAIEAGGFRSTLFAVPNGDHRRDPAYRLQEIVAELADAVRRKFPVALHASYSSIVENKSLSSEAHLLRESGFNVQGSRQHWLRFDYHENLFRAVEEAGLAYDSSLGFPEMCGFRNGASFAFPPYDFSKETAHNFLEIPMVLMDGSLAAMARENRQDPQAIADSILSTSRKWGWGGISVLWHNPMEAIQVPERINKVFWECSAKRKKSSEEWMSAEQFLSHALGRYQAAGLLQEIPFHA